MLRKICQDVLMMAAGDGDGAGGDGDGAGGAGERSRKGGGPSGGNKQGGSRPGGNRPGGSRPGGSRPGGSRPGGSRPGGSKPGGSKPGGSKPGGSKPASKPPASKPPASKPPASKPPASKPPAPKPPAPKPPVPKPPVPKPPVPKPSGKRGFLGRLLDFFENFAKKRNKMVQDKAEKAIRDKQLQRVRELHGLFDKSNPVNHLTIGGRRIELGPENRPYGTAKIFNSQKLTDKQIRDYAQELAGGKKLKQVRDGIYTAKLDDGSLITLRSVSKSKELTGDRWTIDIKGNADLKNLAPKYRDVEIKFK